jgi:hypothetical protein
MEHTTARLAVAAASGEWGGYTNGRIPLSALTPISWDPVERLRPDAAAALEALNVVYRARFGANIAITDSYRDYDAQVRVRAEKGNLAAVPGTSNHGLALAVDLGGGINSFGTVQHNWMRDNAPAYGWIHPAWAQANGSKPEAWHWEFNGSYTPTTPAPAPQEPDYTQEDPMFVAFNKAGGPAVLVYPSGKWALVTDGADAAAMKTAGIPSIDVSGNTFTNLTPPAAALSAA